MPQQPNGPPYISSLSDHIDHTIIMSTCCSLPWKLQKPMQRRSGDVAVDVEHQQCTWTRAGSGQGKQFFVHYLMAVSKSTLTSVIEGGQFGLQTWVRLGKSALVLLHRFCELADWSSVLFLPIICLRAPCLTKRTGMLKRTRSSKR